MIYEFHTDPFKHQLSALKRALRKSKLALLMDPGTGKTKTAIDYAGCRYLRDGHKKIIVLCPKSVLGVWEEEIATHLPPEIPRIVIRFKGSKGELPKENHILTFLLVSYDSAWRITDKLMKWKADGAIADESHYIASATSSRTKGALKIRKSCQWGMILTGTFLPDGPLNAYSQLNFVNPSIFPMSWTKFKKRYAKFQRINGTWDKLIRYKRLKELNGIIMTYATKVDKDEALDLPSRTDQIIPVEMTPKAWRIYNKMKKDKLVEFKKKEKFASADIILTELLRFQQITSGFLTVADEDDEDDKEEVFIHDEKIRTTLELINTHLYYGESVIIFCRFRWEIDRLDGALRKAKINHRVLDGRTKDRDQLRKDFQQKKFCVLVAQIRAGGIGITLTAANIVILYSITFEWDKYQQAKDRVHRPGQDKPVTYYHLIVRKTIDEKILQAVRDKKHLMDKVTAKNWGDFI